MDSVEKHAAERVEGSAMNENQPVESKTVNKVLFSHVDKIAGEERLIVLCDGIFAIATTLLVLNIRITGNPDEADFNAALAKLFSNEILFYVITFFVIANFWVQHRHLMGYIKRQDDRFTWLTLLFLLFVAFFPVTSSVLGASGFRGSVILYTLTFAGCGLSLVLVWLYASWHHRLIDADVSREEIVAIAFRAALTPVYFSLSLLLLFLPIKPTTIFYSWILLPVIVQILRVIMQWWVHRRSKNV